MYILSNERCKQASMKFKQINIMYNSDGYNFSFFI